MARASIESIATVEEDSDDAEESETHYLPNGIYSLEALRFPGLFLGEATNDRNDNRCFFIYEVRSGAEDGCYLFIA